MTSLVNLIVFIFVILVILIVLHKQVGCEMIIACAYKIYVE